MKIASGFEVELDYVMLDEDGEPLESSANDGPMIYLHGEGEIPPRLEAELEGAEPGARFEIVLEPEDAFGDYDPEGIVSVPRADFPPDHALKEGEWVEVCLSDADEPEPSEEEHDHEGDMEARIVEFDDEVVVLDTNHPLAGKRLTFRLEVLDVRPPSD